MEKNQYGSPTPQSHKQIVTEGVVSIHGNREASVVSIHPEASASA
jgi:hypothetical protein